MTIHEPETTTTTDQRDVVEPRVISLDDPRADQVELAGAKAANLAIARRHGLPVYEGFVVTTVGTSTLDTVEESHYRERRTALYAAWQGLSLDGRRELAVRSSSVAEDTTTSSMAGRFVSILRVKGWHAFVDAMFEVVRSAASTELGDAPMAVLVQPMADAAAGGVLFSVDPLTGDRSALRLSIADGLPEQIVSGTVTGTQVVLNHRGHTKSVSGPLPAVIDAKHRHQLAGLARETTRLFGGPQDIEWLVERDGTLRLLQSRPITASALPPEHTQLLGPGPVAETFPNPLSPLERDLWKPPLEDGIRQALRISGAVSNKALARPLVVDVGGRIAVDLEALGIITPRRSLLRRLDPRPPYRRLGAAWRIGRLRGAFPHIASDLVREIDDDLAAVPSFGRLGEIQLLTVLDNAHRILTSLHAHEVLAGFFLDADRTGTTGAAMALERVARGRISGLSDDEIIAQDPVTLALVPPRIGGTHVLPATTTPPSVPHPSDDDPLVLAREAIRLRVRWVHELTAVVAGELGVRLQRNGQLQSADQIRDLPADVVRDLVHQLDRGATVPPVSPDMAPLPARFRLAADGSVVPDLSTDDGGPLGVSSGRAQGVVTHDPAASAGKVLVVASLDPDLAGVLGSLVGLVSETGSPLSHLAILAREYKVPTVVGVVGADDTFHDGDRVLIDGSSGILEIVDTAERTLDAHDDRAVSPVAMPEAAMAHHLSAHCTSPVRTEDSP